MVPTPLDDTNPITTALRAIGQGDPTAASDLLPLVYDELRRLAESRLAKLPPGQTLQATALVHEAYLKLVNGRAADPAWDCRGHFFAAAARAMRDILVDAARRKASVKHGGDRLRIELPCEELAVHVDAPAEQILAIHAALEELESADSRKADVVMLRFFAGLNNEEIAQSLGVSVPTVERDWRFARCWLESRLGNSAGTDCAGNETTGDGR